MDATKRHRLRNKERRARNSILERELIATGMPSHDAREERKAQNRAAVFGDSMPAWWQHMGYV